MLEIIGNHIALLSDEDLRSLIGLLCEADLRKRGLPASAVTWGGNQTAKDGGLDVRVALRAGTAIEGFIPRAATGFQVKKSDMPPSAIGPEMKPKGMIRPVISALAQDSGAYIIVSANGSTADSALSDRRAAMAGAVTGMPEATKLELDFYDRNRIATWVREHAGMMLWVRTKIGKAIPGWRSHGAWSHRPASGGDYLLDETVRIRSATANEGEGLSTLAGIHKLRDALREPGKVVRLVGLSGIGKTRLVEALFDVKIGERALDSALAVYTNVAEGPTPQPSGMASDLVAAGTRAVLVIDNCPPEVHRHLSEIARAPTSTISVITVEYDIREDQPEGTDVFELEPSSPALVEKLLAARFPKLSQVDRQTIADAEFSGGNARIAIALAETVRPGESIKGLGDAELFKRLFEQRHGSNEPLDIIAQALSLVYSFDGENTKADGELAALGRLVGKSPSEMYRGAQELYRRDLAQARSVWRAVLPHAVANRLAAAALENIPLATIQTELIEGDSERLLKSFSRRLGYLDGSKQARSIVASWLKRGGLLADLAKMTGEQQAMFTNVAPAAPEAVLGALEAALATDNAETLEACRTHVRLLRSLAYEAALFDRVVALLVKLATADKPALQETDPERALVTLFYVILSGTHAPVEQRLRWVESWLRSDDKRLRELGAQALGALMQTESFSPSHSFDFGAHSRDYGLWPRGPAALGHWFGLVLGVAEAFSLSNDPVAARVRKAIAAEFRGLWTNANCFDELERIAKAIAGDGFWRDGWIAARQTLRYDGKRLSPEIRERLAALEAHLRPKNLVHQVRGVVLDAKGSAVDLDDLEDGDDYQTVRARLEAAVTRLGTDVAHDPAAFAKLLPELVENSGKLRAFGHALALAADVPQALWAPLVRAFAVSTKKNTQVLNGFLTGIQQRDDALADAMLDEAVTHPALAADFPVLQGSVTIDERGVARLRRALAHGTAPIGAYNNLAYGRSCDPIPGPTFRDLVLAIGERPGGEVVALDILAMRIFTDRSDKRLTVPETMEAGRKLLQAFELPNERTRDERIDHDLALVVSGCLEGSEGRQAAVKLCGRLIEGFDKRHLSPSDYADTMTALFKLHPSEMLDAFFAQGEKRRRRAVQTFALFMRHRANPLSAVPDELILAWSDKDPVTRYPLVAATATLFKRPNHQLPEAWTPLTTKLFAKAPDAKEVLAEIVHRLRPMSWSGSRATKMESRLRLLEQLDTGSKTQLIQAVSDAAASLRKDIATERKHETESERANSGRFE
jgi:hypothetical protein